MAAQFERLCSSVRWKNTTLLLQEAERRVSGVGRTPPTVGVALSRPRQQGSRGKIHHVAPAEPCQLQRGGAGGENIAMWTITWRVVFTGRLTTNRTAEDKFQFQVLVSNHVNLIKH